MSTPKAQILIDTNRTIAPISPLLFGGFAEHMGRCVYEGIYDPKSPQADERGLRKDVLEALRDQGYTVIRYPGGNFLSGYNWLDGVGSKDQRPRRRELAWQSLETNQFGTSEFMEFCRLINVEPMLGVNMGTGTIHSAADLVEYCNVPAGTRWSDLRISYGFQEPHKVRYWCVGNEMDGPWQIGHLDAVSYGNKALEAAKVMKWQDPTIQTVLCGSSNDQMPTYPEWDRTALEIAWEHMDYLSMHYYAGNPKNDTDSYLASAVHFERFVDNLEDALVVAQLLNVFLRKSYVLKIACVAQIVNTISWLHTRADGLLKQPSYYAFKLVSNLARGEALDVHVKAPQLETKQYDNVSALDVSASYDVETQQGAVFLVNRSQ